MSVYSTLIIFMTLLYLLGEKIHVNRKKQVIIAAICLIFIVGFRDVSNIGVDMARYSRIYYSMSGLSFSEGLSFRESSPLYYALNWTFNHIGISFQTYVFIISAFCVSVFCWYAYKWSEAPIFSMMLYLGFGVYTFLFSGLKQSIAMALSILAIDRFQEKKYFALVALTTAAILFHPTAVVLVPFYLVSNIGINQLVLIGYAVALTLSLIFRVPLGRFVTSVYAEGYLDHYTAKESVGGTALIVLAFLIVFVWVYFHEIRHSRTYACRMMHGLFLAFIIQICSSYAYAFTRINLYLMASIITISVPNTIFSKNFLRKVGKITPLVRLILVAALWILMDRLFMAHIRGEYLADFTFIWNR